ncbi:hypothetical protein PRK78_004879 [Emydomyces testavorans]|uniref:Altered inheritance of mitochondria protein 9, mitochondrial n=1 Tax=Emydomyces testavorans TaxID=2070801 RepID=A0AAF0DKP6_9EURO|nr:hypothetical protein PRK78_004879 [Emydomyces testavorans]
MLRGLIPRSIYRFLSFGPATYNQPRKALSFKAGEQPSILIVNSPLTPFRGLSGSPLNTSTLAIDGDPREYIDGRFLHQDTLQRKSRYIEFNFDQLCRIAIEQCEDASGIARYERKEGGYNRVFILTMNTGKRVVARIPTRVAGPSCLITNSEVATVTYCMFESKLPPVKVKTKLSLPVPQILAWSDDPDNPTGTAYIIQEHVEGVQLHEKWPDLNSKEHMLCTKALSLKIRDMANLDFPAFGNIYFADVPIDPKLKIPLQDGFCIGPYCSPLFWNCGPGEPELYGPPSTNLGPWTTLSDYVAGLIDVALARLPAEHDSTKDRLPFRGSIKDHKYLLQKCHETMQKLTEDERFQAAAIPALVHADYNKRNIYVSPDDPTVQTGLIDWQLTCVEPAFIYSLTTPDFASLPVVDPSEEGEAQQKSDDEKRLLKDLSICYQTYDVIMQLKTPKLRPARLLDSSLFRPFQYCYTTWRDGIPAIRQELLDLKALWVELKLRGECPYSPSKEELATHTQQFEDFETMQKLKTWLKIQMQTTSDGWVPNEVWDAAKEANRAAYDEWMQTARESEACGEDMTAEKADRLWPFDARSMPHDESPMDPNCHITAYVQLKGKPDPVKARCTINPAAQQVRLKHPYHGPLHE